MGRSRASTRARVRARFSDEECLEISGSALLGGEGDVLHLDEAADAVEDHGAVRREKQQLRAEVSEQRTLLIGEKGLVRPWLRN